MTIDNKRMQPWHKFIPTSLCTSMEQRKFSVGRDVVVDGDDSGRNLHNPSDGHTLCAINSQPCLPAFFGLPAHDVCWPKTASTTKQSNCKSSRIHRRYFTQIYVHLLFVSCVSLIDMLLDVVVNTVCTTVIVHKDECDIGANHIQPFICSCGRAAYLLNATLDYWFDV